MIRPCDEKDLPALYGIINDAAQAYKGIIPADRWHEPYMPMDHLKEEIGEGVHFGGYEQRGELELLRHAYVKTAKRNHGIGGLLLERLESRTRKPILIGTWAAATWAVRFYEKHGYRNLSREETARLLRKYWNIPERQIETSRSRTLSVLSAYE